MKKSITICVCFVMLLSFSCQQEEKVSPDAGYATDKVKKVIFRDLFSDEAVTTMYFEYKNEKVETVNWNFDFPSVGISRSYSEKRFYNANGDLDSLASSRFNGGPWNLSYEYNGEQLSMVKSYRNDSISTISFLEYSGAQPITTRNLYGIYGIFEGFNYPYYTTLNYDATGNLISQKNTGIPGYPTAVEQKTTTYGTELNPLRDLIKTPLPQAIEYYDDLAFYFSTNLPSSTEANYPYVDPINNRLTFNYNKDEKGRIIYVKALSPAGSSPRYTLDISYY